jgi:hypothetical protein
MLSQRVVSRAIVTIAVSFLAVVGLAKSEASAPPGDTTHYRIDATIHPESGQFDVRVRMEFVPRRPTDTLRFLLHEDLSLQNLDGPLADDYRTRPWEFGGRDSLFTTVVTLPLSRKGKPTDPVSLTWAYEGQLQTERFPPLGGPVVTPHWIELPLEAMWVPIAASLRQRFTFDATLDLPDGYEVVSTGTIQKNGAGWRVASTVPTPDVPLIISDRLRSTTHMSGPLSVTLSHAGAPDSLQSFVSDRTTRIVDRYAERFQSGRDTDELRMTLAPVDRASTSSYARPGLIALRHGVTPDTSLFELLAHEAAHLWWTDATNPASRHNFLNESFAEYEAWRAVQATYGEAAFRTRLERARKKANGAPSFYNWAPQHDGALSYNKGPILLHRLHERIGEATYLTFLRRLQQNDVGTLDGMLNVLRDVSSPDTAEWFAESL